MKTPHSVGEVLDALEDLAQGNNKVSIADAVEAFGERSWGPLILLPALIELTPLGGIPGVPTFLALVIALVAAQMVLGHDHLWMPKLIEDRCVEADKLETGTEKLRPLGRKLDRWFHGRWRRFTHGIWIKWVGVLILVLCATVPPLELLPFASSAPMLVIACFGLALMVRDGLLILVAITLAMVSLGSATYLLLSSTGGG